MNKNLCENLQNLGLPKWISISDQKNGKLKTCN